MFLRLLAVSSLVVAGSIVGTGRAPAPPANACSYATNYGCFWTGSGQNTRVRGYPSKSKRSEARSGFGTTDVTAAHWNAWSTGPGYAGLSYGADNLQVWCDAGYQEYSQILVGCNYIKP